MIDDRTAQYIIETQKHFEDLKQAASQLAGLLVLEAAGSREAAPDHPLRASAKQLYRSAADGLGGIRTTRRARAHHGYLLAAAEKLGAAFEAEDPLTGLRAAYEELRAASRSLPGFEMISFEQCCCFREKSAA